MLESCREYEVVDVTCIEQSNVTPGSEVRLRKPGQGSTTSEVNESFVEVR